MKVKLLVFYEVVWKICVKTTRLPNIKLQSRKKSRPFISISKDLEMQCCQLEPFFQNFEKCSKLEKSLKILYNSLNTEQTQTSVF